MKSLMVMTEPLTPTQRESLGGVASEQQRALRSTRTCSGPSGSEAQLPEVPRREGGAQRAGRRPAAIQVPSLRGDFQRPDGQAAGAAASSRHVACRPKRWIMA